MCLMFLNVFFLMFKYVYLFKKKLFLMFFCFFCLDILLLYIYYLMLFVFSFV